MNSFTVQYWPNPWSCGYTDRIMSMMIGVAFSLGLVSMRVIPSMRVGMFSSACSDIGVRPLPGRNLLSGRLFDRLAGEKRCERRDFVGGTLDADHRGPVCLER